VTLDFTVVAPTLPGTYELALQMSTDVGGAAEGFGQIGTVRTILVGQTVRQGAVETISSDTVSGWALDPREPYASVFVDVYFDGVFYARVPANVFRGDLRAVGIGDGWYGFSYPIPQSLRDGAAHTVEVRFAGTDQPLQWTPRSMGIALPDPDLPPTFTVDDTVPVGSVQ
jgi:hypothetical protein